MEPFSRVPCENESDYFSCGNKGWRVADSADECPDAVLAKVSSSLSSFRGRNCRIEPRGFGGRLPLRRL